MTDPQPRGLSDEAAFEAFYGNRGYDYGGERKADHYKTWLAGRASTEPDLAALRPLSDELASAKFGQRLLGDTITIPVEAPPPAPSTPPTGAEPDPFPPTGLEPRGCPMPGACSCPTGAVPEGWREAAQGLLDALADPVKYAGSHDYEREARERLRQALAASPPAPSPRPEEQP